MKKISLIILVMSGCLISSAYAADEIWFTTIEEAKQYCPAENTLTYIETMKPDNQPYSMGLVFGYHPTKFTSIAVLPKPTNLNQNNVILDAKFTKADIIYTQPIYGFKAADNIVNCFYSYMTYGNNVIWIWLKG
jgi:hypothetical protein